MNPGDWRIAKGTASKIQSFNLPKTMGSDFTGEIIKFGAKFDRKKYDYNVNDYVVGSLGWTSNINGCMSEYVSCNPENIVKLNLPNVSNNSDNDNNDNNNDNKKLVEYAGVGIAGLTRYISLIKTGGIDNGNVKKILILGGSTACGLFGIQLCKSCNISEIHVTSSKKQLCESLGATKVYNYKEVKNENEQWYNVLKDGNFDIIYDCVATGGKHYQLCSSNKILDGKTGKYISLCGDLDENMGVLGYGTMASMAYSQVTRKFMSMFNEPEYYVTDFKVTQNDLQALFKIILDKNIQSILDEESPLLFNEKNAYYMFNKSETQKAHGKLILSFINDGNNKEIKNDSGNNNDKSNNENGNQSKDNTESKQDSY